jgi:hypothetical protein
MSALEQDGSPVVEPARPSVFGDVEEKIVQAIEDAVSERRRAGLAIAVDYGRGVELIR